MSFRAALTSSYALNGDTVKITSTKNPFGFGLRPFQGWVGTPPLTWGFSNTKLLQPDSPDHAILPGDIIRSDDELTIDQLVVEGSVTIYAEGDIIICGDIETRGTNPAGGPNVVALIAEGDVILDPSGDTTGQYPCWDDLPSAPAELNTSHNLTLTNVAVLAPEGAVYARRWHLPHAATGGPTLTIEGSIAAKHLGLYGIPDQTTGTITSGWAKTFTYPTDFSSLRGNVGSGVVEGP